MHKIFLYCLISLIVNNCYSQSIAVKYGDTTYMFATHSITPKTYKDTTLYDLKMNLPKGEYKVYQNESKKPVIIGYYDNLSKKDSNWLYQTNEEVLIQKDFYADGILLFSVIFTNKFGELDRSYFARIFYSNENHVNNYFELGSDLQLLKHWQFDNVKTLYTSFYPGGGIEYYGEANNEGKNGIWIYFLRGGKLEKIVVYKNDAQLKTIGASEIL